MEITATINDGLPERSVLELSTPFGDCAFLHKEQISIKIQLQVPTHLSKNQSLYYFYWNKIPIIQNLETEKQFIQPMNVMKKNEIFL